MLKFHIHLCFSKKGVGKESRINITHIKFYAVRHLCQTVLTKTGSEIPAKNFYE